MGTCSGAAPLCMDRRRHGMSSAGRAVDRQHSKSWPPYSVDAKYPARKMLGHRLVAHESPPLPETKSTMRHLSK